jgi:photosystem II oxygen-evolving enhancer protein 2
VVAPIRDGFSLMKMGTPMEAAWRFMESIAPENSGKIATLLSANARKDPVDGEMYYVMEFIIEIPNKFKRHNIAAYGSRNGLLYTFNAQASEERYNRELEAAYKKAANSFRMTSSGASTAGFPDRL